MLLAQATEVHGRILDSLDRPIPDVYILMFPDSVSTMTNSQGRFNLNSRSDRPELILTHIQFQSRVVYPVKEEPLVVRLQEKIQILSDVDVRGDKYSTRNEIGNIEINAKSAYTLPSATGDFSKIIGTLPGVVTNNELSTVYSVRGGNFDENLIYVNGIKVYRPFLVSTGRQEGMSFVNSDMVGNVQFSAGGWQAKYGDKLSSVLNVQYAEPQTNEATINLSLLGGRIYFGGVNKSKDFSYSIGARHKNTKYLLGTLETKGQYLPKFTDFQAYLSKRIGKKTKIGFLTSSAINNYLTVPASKQTDFGTIQASFRMTVAFEGQEILDYNTHQAGLILSHSFTENFLSKLVVSGVYSQERENYDVEGGYLLCDVNSNPSSNRFNQCATIRGIGSNYKYGRNKLEARMLTVDQKNELQINNDLLEFGMSWEKESFEDRLKEFSFTDSADVSKNFYSVNNEIDIQSHKIGGFAQYTVISSDGRNTLNFGIRLSYWSFSNQLLVSPRAQYAIRLGSRQQTSLRVAAGLYQQHPFYRELRDRQGDIQNDVKAQSSLHIVTGIDHYFKAWGRPFKLMGDMYYKRLWQVNPYDVDNIKIRYFGTNQATAYAYGIDFRVNGEFIDGLESWFSLGILSTKENLGEGTGDIRRPSDQRINLGIFFQDHMPNDPSLKVSMSMLFGSGLPFGPPGNDALRNAFNGDEYYRLDLGFSKSIEIKNDKALVPNSLWIGLEVLNVLGAQNTISYSWIQDVNGNSFAVPNSLSARFLNVRLIGRF
jgi:hypothetical protein